MTETQSETTGIRSWLAMRSFRKAIRLVPVWLPITLVMFLLAAPLGAPRYDFFEGVLGNRYAPGEEVYSLSQDFRTDHGSSLRALDAWTADAAAFVGFLAILVGLLAAGGWLQVLAGAGEGSMLRRMAFGGARFFWRYFRLLVLTLLVIAGWRELVYGDLWDQFVLQRWLGVPDHDLGRLETLASEAHKLRLDWAQHGLFALLFSVTLAWATYVRTRIALRDSWSVFLAGAASLWLLVRHPIQCLRPLLALLLVEAALVTGVLGQGARFLNHRLSLEAGGLGEVIGLFALGLAALVLGEVLRGAKYVATLEVSRALLPPIHRPDPWHTIGGPGGPQYPVDDDADERYGVSL